MSTPTVTTSPLPIANWRSSVISTASTAISQYEPRFTDWLRIQGLVLAEEDKVDVQSLIEEFEEQISQLEGQLSQVVPSVQRPTFKKRTKGALLGKYGKWISKIIPKSHSDRLPSSESTTNTAIESLQNSINALRSLSAPIRRLPPELLSEIFIHCLPDNNPFIRPRRSPPLLVAQICASWRIVAISTPRLWSTIAMTRIDKPACHKTTISGLRTWLSRSGDRPLWASFHADAFPYGGLDEILNTYHHRFEYIRLVTGYQLHPVIEQNTRFRRLKYFDLRTPYELPGPIETRFSDALASATELKEFSWINMMRVPRIRNVPFAVCWGGLTRLVLHSPTDAKTCLGVIAQATQLKYLAVNNLGAGGSLGSGQMVVLPHLTQFIVDSCAYTEVLLSNLVLPALKDFLLNIRIWAHQAVVSLLERSQCPLESINIYFSDITEEQVLEVLQITQSTLREFTVQTDPQEQLDAPFGDSICAALTVDVDNEEVLCPNLDTIALYECISCSYNTLEKMLLSRSERAICDATLSNNKQDLSSSPPSTTQPPIRPLRLLQAYDCPQIRTSLAPLRTSGLLVRLFSAENKSMDMPERDEEKLERLVKEEGLFVRLYDPSTGYFDSPEGHW